MLKRLSLLSLMLIIAIGGYSQNNISKTFRGIKEIKLSTASGDTEIKKSNNAEVTVEVTYTYSEDNFTPILEQDGDVLILKEKFSNNRSGSGSSSWDLTVPDNLEISFNSGSGDLEARGITTELSANSGSGDVEISNLVGDFSSNTGSGDVAIENYKGDLKINTGSGDIELSKASGELEINLGSGDIDAEGIEGGVRFNAGSGDITVRDAVITNSSSLNSGSGDAEVILKSALKANISINSGSGDATLDFNGLEVTGEFTMKANKKNGEISAPFKFDDVSEEKQGNQTIVTKKAKIGNSDIAIKIGTGSGRASVKK